MLDLEKEFAPKKKTLFTRWEKILFIKWTRLSKKISNYLKRKMHDDFVQTESQALGIKIFEKALSNKDAELLLAPISRTLYIELNDIFIIMEGKEILIINGKYQYNIVINETNSQILTDKFNRVLESRRKKMERKVIAKTSRSLNDILSGLESMKE